MATQKVLPSTQVVTSGEHSRLSVMNFLNEISSQYPSAISFASGRPTEAFFNLTEWIKEISRFTNHVAATKGFDEKTASDWIAQYGRTNGIINDLIAQQVRQDEGIRVDESEIVVTAGCQEAIELCVAALCKEPTDVILVRNPTYIGITGVADIKRIEIRSLSIDGNSPGAFKQAIDNIASTVAAEGKKIRLLYLIPDFDNPTGEVLSENAREEILQECVAKRIVLLEDNPYGLFRYDGDKVATMYSLDRSGGVIYLGTYSKSLCPSLRVGFAILPRALWGDEGASRALIRTMSEAKSFGTCNTSQVTQAIVGGLLIKENFSLSRLVEKQIKLYRENRNLMLKCLEQEFVAVANYVTWNEPKGGFFIIVSLPFDFGKTETELCAEKYGFICMPLSFFTLTGTHKNYVRFAFSNVLKHEIKDGVSRFAHFVRDQLRHIALSG